MSWPTPLRVHCANGRIYLDPKEWVNVDLDGPHANLARDRADLVARWLTTDGDAYYARQTQATPEALAEGPLRPSETVCDVKADILRGLPFGPQAVDELLIRQAFEHFSRVEARKFLQECDYSLKPGGILRLDVPDHEATLRECAVADDVAKRRLLLRHIVGSRKDDYSYHLHGYTRDGLRALVEEYGFVFEAEEPELAGRLYPAFCLRFRKPLVASHDPIPWQRLVDPSEIPDDWKCVEVGPGSHRAWPRANAVIDVVNRGAPDDRPDGSDFHMGDICDRTPFADGAFDLLFASHVLEHVRDPEAAAAEISRIAKRVVIECPHPMKEFLFGFEEEDHRWWVWPAGPDGVLIFQRPDERLVKGWRHVDWSGAMHRILVGGPGQVPDAHALRRRYAAGQRSELLNVVHRGETPLRVRVVG